MSFAGVLCTGNIVIDVLTRPVDEIKWGGTRWVESITQSLGGNGANTAAAIAMLGVPARLIGGIGRDRFGEEAIARLEECGVDTSCIARRDEPTATSVALVQSGGARAFLHQPGVSRAMFAEPLQLDAQAILGCGRFHLGNPFSMTNLRRQAHRVLEQARGLGLRTSMDTAWDALGEWMAIAGPCLPHTDLLFTNEDEARMLTGSSDPQVIANVLRGHGARSIVLKLGPKGCVVFDGAERLDVEAFAVDAIDTTGAGDCFAGAFLASLQRGLPMSEAAPIANAVGALNVQSLGATAGLRTWQQTMDWMAGASPASRTRSARSSPPP